MRLWLRNDNGRKLWSGANLEGLLATISFFNLKTNFHQDLSSNWAWSSGAKINASQKASQTDRELAPDAETVL